MDEEKSKKKKLPLPVRLLLIPVKIVLGIIALVIIWCTFCFFNRTSSVSAMPDGFALYLRSDSVWETVNPLLDIDASLVLLSTPEFQNFRQPFLELKKSPLRNNFFVKTALSRRVDTAVYNFNENEKLDAVFILDAGILSGFTRLIPFCIKNLKLQPQNLKINTFKNEYGTYFELEGTGYFVIHKNLVIFTMNDKNLSKIMTFSNKGKYNDYEMNIFNEKMKEPLRIAVNSSNVVENFSSMLQNPYINSIVKNLSDQEYSILNFGISESNLNISLSVPFSIPEEAADNPLLKLISKDSKVPSLLPKLADTVQYYTLINCGSLRELKDAALIALQDKNIAEKWSITDYRCKLIFGKPLEELLFSWTGDEFIAFGIEGKAEPVFGIKISDESKRQEIFDTIFSSIILQSNDSLLVDGIRLPCIELPPFLSALVTAFGIDIPRPYYLVTDGFIFFSQSPENLVGFNSALKIDNRLSKNENWKAVSSLQSLYSSLSIYYNLERSVPFFVRGNSTLSKIIRLYNLGRFDLDVKDATLTLNLQSANVQNGSVLNIPGFPKKLSEDTSHTLIASNAPKSNLIFWKEGLEKIRMLNLSTFAEGETVISDLEYLIAASEETASESGGEIWAVTKQGLCFLLDKNLQAVKGFPLMLGVSTLCQPTVYKSSLMIATRDSTLCFVSSKGDVKTIETSAEENIRSTPSVFGDYIAFYEKGFLGGVHILKNLKEITETPFEIDGIAYEAPCLFKKDSKTYAAFITQAGLLYLFDLQTKSVVSGFPVKLDDIFYVNVKAADDYIFALSSSGNLYRVSMEDASSTLIKIPHLSAQSGRITVCDYDKNKSEEIFVSGEGNQLYGFSSSLDMLYKFPVSGYGNPVFADINSDNKKDCIVITFDSKLNALNVLK
ncbi:hypothetical protein [Treponema sp. C6A8]|uniref:hypothetical protein n=1 Tax=Treponema sp. C6A8 TaxID=1410609 RepID=UPI00047F81B7|nr:hypothetical protein [Treponema sp. C6A8]